MRKTGSLFLHLTLEPSWKKSVCYVTYDYETRWPKWTEYPADANFGRFLSSLMIIYENDMANNMENLHAENRIQNVFSGPLLIYVPIPDFSMPYNVLCLVSTVIAMGIGALHNLTTSQLVASKVEKDKGELYISKYSFILFITFFQNSTKARHQSWKTT